MKNSDINHLITPPPELVEQWCNQAPKALRGASRQLWIATQAARWGADQELDACFDFVYDKYEGLAERMHAARRPKPPSLKEQALEDFDGLMSELDWAGNYSYCAGRIRRALEQLPD